MSRLAELSYDDMDEAQRRMHDDILSGPRSNLAGPMNAWFRSPELGNLAQQLGAYCRYKTGLEPRLSELAILLVGRFWSAHVEWGAHKPLALKAGLDEGVIDAIKARRRPEFTNADEEALYDLAMELQQNHEIGDEVYDRALGVFGEKTLVELVTIIGYYTSVAMVLNTFRVPPLEGREKFDD